jgi:DNA-binding NarL/FixJ family response regulator
VRVVIADDQTFIRRGLRAVLSDEKGSSCIRHGRWGDSAPLMETANVNESQHAPWS